ncbi:helix-turn-helix transcriptional regulator [Sinanaerobacter sp. ZZT-01]|uniref:helix-turn-helix transcriptional regulator n=1 Tax=Sinanaerobacter sp. ZZT-01 TaxID=3111540 RepID=UPI002D789DB9|nr:helix-turn-helix transcriptional regulator [Sinanaerobacter sp. ZZT-01]WRR93240.1 helix-turn-helix transcriptional regulator [Sinanaerobacter sp. ZZT-01]
MAYLEESEWMLLNEIAYNISFIYSFDEMQKSILDWLKLLIDYDGAAFALIKKDEDKNLLYNSVGNGIKEKMLKKWQEQTAELDNTRWIIYSARNTAFRESDLISPDKRTDNKLYKEFYLPSQFYYSAGLCIVFREEPVGLLKLFRSRGAGDFSARDLFALDQLQKHFAYRLYYEKTKGDTRYFFAKGYHEKICKRYNLTERESELFNYAIQGFTNIEISEQMNISIHTVKKHFHSIYNKMHVKNRVQLLQCMPLSTSKINFDEL